MVWFVSMTALESPILTHPLAPPTPFKRHSKAVKTYPHKPRRAPRKHPIRICHRRLSPRRSSSTSTSPSSSRTRTSASPDTGARKTDTAGCEGRAGGGAFDVVVEAFNDVAGGGFFEVGLFEAVDLVF